MTDGSPLPLRGLRILVVEDDYLIAEDLAQTLTNGGAEVLGPASTLVGAQQFASSPNIDGAVLDVSVRGEKIWPVADQLIDRRVPVLFATGYTEASVPERFERVPLFDKPVVFSLLMETLARRINATSRLASAS